MNDEEAKEMNEKFEKEWYPHIVIFQMQKIPYDQPPTNRYYRVSRALWEDLQIWFNSQEDVYKL